MEVKAVLGSPVKINWGEKLVLDHGALRQTMIQLSVVSRFFGTPMWVAVEYYLGGLTFLSLTEIHFRFDVQAYGNFHACLKTVMKEYGGWNEGEPFDQAFSRLMEELAAAMPPEQRRRYVAIAAAYEANAPETVAVTLEEVALVKILCDTYFAGTVGPVVLKDLGARTKEADDT